jgi:hypothetical protein
MYKFYGDLGEYGGDVQTLRICSDRTTNLSQSGREDGTVATEPKPTEK